MLMHYTLIIAFREVARDVCSTILLIIDVTKISHYAMEVDGT